MKAEIPVSDNRFDLGLFTYGILSSLLEFLKGLRIHPVILQLHRCADLPMLVLHLSVAVLPDMWEGI